MSAHEKLKTLVQDKSRCSAHKKLKTLVQDKSRCRRKTVVDAWLLMEGRLEFLRWGCSPSCWGKEVPNLDGVWEVLSMESRFGPGPWFNIKMSSYQYRKSHWGDKTVVRSSHLHNGISYTGKMTSLYWFTPLVCCSLYYEAERRLVLQNQSIHQSIKSSFVKGAGAWVSLKSTSFWIDGTSVLVGLGGVLLTLHFPLTFSSLMGGTFGAASLWWSCGQEGQCQVELSSTSSVVYSRVPL